MMGGEGDLDRITMEVPRNSFSSLVDEMGLTLSRSALSLVITFGKDFERRGSHEGRRPREAGHRGRSSRTRGDHSVHDPASPRLVQGRDQGRRHLHDQRPVRGHSPSRHPHDQADLLGGRARRESLPLLSLDRRGRLGAGQLRLRREGLDDGGIHHNSDADSGARQDQGGRAAAHPAEREAPRHH